MAVIIFHGAAGSYKSSMAVQERMLPALKAGRIVVSNIEGLYPLDIIQDKLKTTFPDTARLYRISTQKDKGQFLIRNWYHWLPPSALLIIDEVQDIYPDGRLFKPEEYDYRPFTHYKDDLPTDLYQLHEKILSEFKPDEFDESHTDDLGEVLFNSDGTIIYPKTLKESFMRHRKYNWDLILCTPDIKEVNMFIRGVAEKAFAHSSKDAMPIPYFQRRPRILEHPPKENGLSQKAGDVVRFNTKIKLETFSVYKSTATGKTNKSGEGGNPLGTKLYLMLLLLFSVLGFAIYKGSQLTEELPKDSSVPDVVDPLPAQTSNTVVSQNPVSRVNTSGIEVTQVNRFFNGRWVRDSRSNVFSAGDVALPYSATEFYLSGTNLAYGDGFVDHQYVFTFKLPRKEDEQFFINSNSLKSMGYSLVYHSMCRVDLVKDGIYKSIYCEPQQYLEGAKTERFQDTEGGSISSSIPTVSL